jgi:hypothetical protein
MRTQSHWSNIAALMMVLGLLFLFSSCAPVIDRSDLIGTWTNPDVTVQLHNTTFQIEYTLDSQIRAIRGTYLVDGRPSMLRLSADEYYTDQWKPFDRPIPYRHIIELTDTTLRLHSPDGDGGYQEFTRP